MVFERPTLNIGGRQLVGGVALLIMVVIAALIGSASGLLLVYSTDLPQVSELEHYRPSAITELYDHQGRIIGSFALQRRFIASYHDYPKLLREAVTSIEDKDFEKHWGINIWRVLGAAYRDITTGSRGQGASTLTMQLSRNLFLSSERHFARKIQEAMLAIQIERRFTKQQIFTLYANQIPLGHSVFGFEAGAQFYFNKHAKDLKLEEATLLAALPRGPSLYSPINNPERALRRRNLVINAMLEDGKITVQEATRAKAEPLKLNLQSPPNSLAPYFVEEIRRYLEKKYGSEEVHQGGLRVYTSLNLDLQRAANRAVLDGLAAYERRHGWKGNRKNVVSAYESLKKYKHPDWDETLESGTYVHALVTEVSSTQATLKIGKFVSSLSPGDIAWTGKKYVSDLLTPGDLVYVKVVSPPGERQVSSTAKPLKSIFPRPASDPGNRLRVSLEQDSGVQAALLALDNTTGDIKAMVGGRDFNDSKFNHATQALRQVGSSFKPYVYTAAVDTAGITPEDVIIDAPTTFMTAAGPYTPHNYDMKFEGTITFRHAFAMSRNIPALKLAQQVGIHTVIDYARKFGITSNLPAYLPVALGSAEITLYEQVAAFSTFPNDGIRIAPRYIRKVEDYDGHVLEENFPEVRDALSARTARIMTSLLREVVLHGTATPALKLQHPLGGKTGTTNDFTDAWFIGFSPSLTCGVWIGFDEKKTLGKKETGAVAALPVWIDFMRTALADKDKQSEEFPESPAPLTTVMARRTYTPEPSKGNGEAH